MKITRSFYLVSAAIITLGTVTTSCGLSDELDKLNNIDSIEAKASFNANLLNNTLLLKDIIPSEKLNLTELPDGTYKLGFETSNNFLVANPNFPIMNTNPIDDIPLSALNLSPDYNSISIGSYFDMPVVAVACEISRPEVGNALVSEDFKIKEIKLKDGAKINLELNIADSNADVVIAVEIPSLTKNNVAYYKVFDPIVGSQNMTLIMNDLAGYVLDTDPNVKILLHSMVKRTSYPVAGDINAAFSIELGDKNEYVKGFLGETVIKTDPIEVPISTSDLIEGNKNGDMIVKEATITISAQKSGLQVPTDLDFTEGNLCYYKGNDSGQPITLTRLECDIPDTFKFKIKDINVLNIEKFVLSPKVTLNKGLSSGENYITDNAQISYSINTEVPLDLTIQSLMFREEAANPFKDLSLNEEDYQILDGRVLVRGSVISELPLGATLQVYYRNESEDDTYLSPLFDSPIVISSGTSNFEMVITTDKLDIINKYPYQVIQLTLDGTGAIMSSQKITFKVGVAVRGTFKGKIN